MFMQNQCVAHNSFVPFSYRSALIVYTVITVTMYIRYKDVSSTRRWRNGGVKTAWIDCVNTASSFSRRHMPSTHGISRKFAQHLTTQVYAIYAVTAPPLR